ncbi:hypothetical protein CIK06_05615 [Plantactinospora sp. KBS50]|nr:hypothetical protein CIK06_05615 [Plantactinospora sp. KBS50]
MNFVAVEPTPVGATERGYSELEWSALDGCAGKRIHSADRPDGGDPDRPAPGVLDRHAGVERLTVHFPVERFDNGAEVCVRARFRADRPHEVALAAWPTPASVDLAVLTLTATMGNYARLRRLHLADRTVTAGGLWPGFDGSGFTRHARFGLAELSRTPDGGALVTASTDEPDPSAAGYADEVAEHWRYVGAPAVQGWRVRRPGPELAVLVNGRSRYWASTAPIPGGVAFENVELHEPYRPGHEQEYVFSVTPAVTERC